MPLKSSPALPVLLSGELVIEGSLLLQFQAEADVWIESASGPVSVREKPEGEPTCHSGHQ